MIKAKEIISPSPSVLKASPRRSVTADTPILDVLHKLLDTPDRTLAVVEGTETLGVIDQSSMLEAMGRFLAPRDDSSVITVECPPADFSASQLAHAVEDTDSHLVDMVTTPTENGRISATLRVRRLDPSPTVHSLERYGYEVTDVRAAQGDSDFEQAAVRLLELRSILNV